jgi:flagellar protein FlaF
VTQLTLALSGYHAGPAPLRSDRGIEYDAFAKATRSLIVAKRQGQADFAGLAQAVHNNRRLWAALAASVADPSNALPKPLRAQIFFLAEFTDKHSRKVLHENADLTALIDINTAIMRGLEDMRGAA